MLWELFKRKNGDQAIILAFAILLKVMYSMQNTTSIIYE